MLLQLIGIFATVLVVYLIASYLISKNNSEIIYEEDMDEEEFRVCLVTVLLKDSLPISVWIYLTKGEIRFPPFKRIRVKEHQKDEISSPSGHYLSPIPILRCRRT